MALWVPWVPWVVLGWKGHRSSGRWCTRSSHKIGMLFQVINTGLLYTVRYDTIHYPLQTIHTYTIRTTHTTHLHYTLHICTTHLHYTLALHTYTVRTCFSNIGAPKAAANGNTVGSTVIKSAPAQATYAPHAPAQGRHMTVHSISVIGAIAIVSGETMRSFSPHKRSVLRSALERVFHMRTTVKVKVSPAPSHPRPLMLTLKP
jgi:hypothetical protein